MVVGLDDLRRELAVALDDRLDRGGELAFGQPAHLDDDLVQALEFLVVALDDVLGSHRACPVLTDASAEAPGDVVLGLPLAPDA